MTQSGKSSFVRPFLWALVTALALVLALPGASAAEDEDDKKPPEDMVMKATGDSDWVMLSHTKHLAVEGAKCKNCHPKTFAMKAGKTAVKKGPLTMAAMEKGELCGACHNGGNNVFDVKTKDDCVKCHSVKKE